MGNYKWSESFPTGCCEYLWFEGSDHRPVLVYLHATKPRKRRLFRFDKRLAQKPEIMNLVETHWTRPIPYSILTKICLVRQKIIEWTKAQNANSKALILSTQQLLEVALSSSTPDPTIIGELTQKLEDHYKEEELFWRQRSRIQWLNCGERNTAFFHDSTRGHRSANKFSVIENDEGVAHYEEEKIASTVASYYANIFTSQALLQTHDNDPWNIVEEVPSPLVSPEVNSQLITTPDAWEIRMDLFAINTDKAPGPDGFSVCFYQNFWDIIRPDVARDIQSFFETGSLNWWQKETHVRLIPKIPGPRKVADYRTIALCTTHYKIISKILKTRLQPPLQNLISKQQSAFVKNRAISDNVLITHEILNYL